VIGFYAMSVSGNRVTTARTRLEYPLSGHISVSDRAGAHRMRRSQVLANVDNREFQKKDAEKER
jgi:MoxR-like ATPase